MSEPAVDLGKLKSDAAAAQRAIEAAAAEKRRQTLEREATAWDKAMTRTFKGILSAPERRRQLIRSANAA